jgi:hypothetical protein
MSDVLVPDTSRGLLLAESAALHAKLSNITVANPKAPGGRQRAQVWFGMPTGERERSYPYITIDFLGMQFAYDRAHSAQLLPVDYWPSEYATFDDYAEAYGFEHWVGAAGDGRVAALAWHPYDLQYQVTTHARNRMHDMEMTALLIGTSYLPDRWGYLDVTADNSVRWLDRVSMFDNSTLEGSVAAADRVFSKVYTINVSAHVPPELPIVYLQVLKLAGTLRIHPEPDHNVAAQWEHPEQVA